MEFYFDHINYFAKDIERAKSFYTNTLGLDLVCQGAPHAFSVKLDKSNFIVVLQLDEADSNDHNTTSAVFRVDNLEETLTSLKAKKVSILSDLEDRTSHLRAAILDTEGNRIFLIERKRKA
ncbi:MAG: hypothetical protein COA79_01430 [Planctomycetota bacterium]|nr:MAG: hypothetical protein COA79_01430 [Planctomycetota bacterium]